MQLSLFPPFSMSRFPPPKDNYEKLPKTGSRRAAVLFRLLKAGRRGATDDELEVALPGLNRQQILKARSELIEGGFVMDSNTRRESPLADPAIVWRATDRAVRETTAKRR